MQRMAPQALPPRRQESAGGERSPAHMMANRIRMEQGPERAAQYLAAMEPYLAPGERTHIATALGLPIIQPAPAQQPSGMNAGPLGGMNAGPLGGMNLGGLQNLGGMMQMMQLLGGMQGGGGAQGGGGGNPMQLAQMLSGLMGGKK